MKIFLIFHKNQLINYHIIKKLKIIIIPNL